MYIVPLTNYPNQTFTASIPVNGENMRFKFFLTYNEQAEYWMATISNYATEEVYCYNIPLLSTKGVLFDILHQLGYKNIGKCMILPLEEDLKSMPNDENLGTNYIMIWGDNDE